MATHTNMGDLALAVGHYTKGNDERKRYRNIGTLMKTTHSDGREGFWLKLNAEILQSSLYALVRVESMQKGDDAVIVTCFEPRQQATKPSATASAEIPEQPIDDDIPF